MIIKVIDNTDFLSLIKLNIAMYSEIDPNINEFGATNTLMHYINTKPGFIALGLYDDNETELVGFVTGHELTKKEFYFCGIYVIIKNNEWTKKLIDFSFTFIQDKGYSAWSVDATNGNISSIMEKYGATAQYTRYYKEME